MALQGQYQVISCGVRESILTTYTYHHGFMFEKCFVKFKKENVDNVSLILFE